MTEFSINDGSEERKDRRLETGTYVCIVKECFVGEATKGPCAGLPEINFRFRVMLGPKGGLEIVWRGPIRAPTDEESGRGIKNLAWITKKNIQAAFLPLYKNGDIINTDDFLGKRCNVTIEMVEGSKWPRVKAITPYVDSGELGEFDEKQYFGDPDIV